MNIQKIFEGIAIVSGCALFIATSEMRESEAPGLNDIPYQRITTNGSIGYQCPLGFGVSAMQQFHLTNMRANTHTVHIAVRGVSYTDTGLDTGLDLGEWTDLDSIELEGTTPSNRSAAAYSIEDNDIAVALGSSPSTVDFMLYGNPDEDIDIVVEGHHWDICFVLDLSEENQ